MNLLDVADYYYIIVRYAPLDKSITKYITLCQKISTLRILTHSSTCKPEVEAFINRNINSFCVLLLYF